MEKDFPQDELKPLDFMLEMMQKKKSIAVELMDGQKMLAYAVFIIPEDAACMLLDYFAVIKEYRGTGVGHTFFEVLPAFMQERYPMQQRMLLEVECVADGKQDLEIRKRRVAFYLGCGCKMTRIETVLFGVHFSILCYPFAKDTHAEESDLRFIYEEMLGTEYEKHVKIWEIE